MLGEVGVQQMWNPRVLPRSFGPWILQRISCLSLNMSQTSTRHCEHILQHRLCIFTHKMCKLATYELIVPYMSVSWEVPLTRASHYESTSLVTKLKNRFPHFVVFGEVGVQQMWKPSLLPRSFAPGLSTTYQAYPYPFTDKHIPWQTHTSADIVYFPT